MGKAEFLWLPCKPPSRQNRWTHPRANAASTLFLDKCCFPGIRLTSHQFSQCSIYRTTLSCFCVSPLNPNAVKPKGEEGNWFALVVVVFIYIDNALNCNLLLKPCPLKSTHPLSWQFFSGFCSVKIIFFSFCCSFSILYQKIFFFFQQKCVRWAWAFTAPALWNSQGKPLGIGPVPYAGSSQTPSHPSAILRPRGKNRDQALRNKQEWGFFKECRPRRCQGTSKPCS